MFANHSNKLKVDYIIGQNKRSVTGLDRYLNEMYFPIAHHIIPQFIGYNQPHRYISKMPLVNIYRFITEQLIYPINIRKKLREKSIIHVRSQEESRFLSHILHRQAIIINCHDLCALDRKEYKLTAGRLVKQGLEVIRDADIVITVSNFSKQRIKQLINVRSDKIYVIPNGVNRNSFRPFYVDDATYAYLNLNKKDRYILYVGSDEPRKNVINLIESFSVIKRYVNKIKLIIVGNGFWNNWKKEKMQAKKLFVETDVIFLGYVPEKLLPSLYNIANIFVYPSEYEGFGLPPLEAMACGTPVVVSNRTSLPEVIGNAGILINPDNINELNNAIINIFNDDNLWYELHKKGLYKARLFSWSNSAKSLLSIYKKLDLEYNN